MANPTRYDRIVSGRPDANIRLNPVPTNGTPGTLASSGTISHNGNNYVRVTTAGAVTGIILQQGLWDGQPLYVENISANLITFAAVATSFVRDGASSNIPAKAMRTFIWNAVDGVWTMETGISGGALSVSTATVSTADGLTVGGVIVPQNITVSVSCVANAACVDQAFFIANRAYQVTAIREIHAVAGDDVGAVNLQVVKDTGTDAPGAGTDLLTNNTNAGFDMKGTANTVQVGTLTATTASLQLAAGNRLSLDFAGTVTTLAGVVVTVSLKPI